MHPAVWSPMHSLLGKCHIERLGDYQIAPRFPRPSRPSRRAVNNAAVRVCVRFLPSARTTMSRLISLSARSFGPEAVTAPPERCGEAASEMYVGVPEDPECARGGATSG